MNRKISSLLKVRLFRTTIWQGRVRPNHQSPKGCDKAVLQRRPQCSDYMFAALKARPVKGCTATVCKVDPAVKEIKVNKILNFNIFHNFSYEKNGLRMWKAFEVGSGQLLSWRTLHVQFPASNISAKPVSEDLDFWDVQPRVVQLQKEADPEAALFECNEAGCS